MKVTEVTPFSGEYVTVEGEFYSEYSRASADSWQIRMGESWEQIYDCAEIEAAYQAFKASRP